MAKAQQNFGVMYGKGHGIPQDYVEALKWHRKAAEQGHAEAQQALGGMYALGLGVPRDLIQAYAWCGVSAAGGFSKAVQCYQAVEQHLGTAEREKARQLTVEFRQKYIGQ